jgi:hypothetical protein
MLGTHDISIIDKLFFNDTAVVRIDGLALGAYSISLGFLDLIPLFQYFMPDPMESRGFPQHFMS